MPKHNQPKFLKAADEINRAVDEVLENPETRTLIWVAHAAPKPLLKKWQRLFAPEHELWLPKPGQLVIWREP